MHDQDLFEKIRDIIVNVKADTVVIERETISESSELSELPLAMDSIDFVRMIIEIEEAFGIIADDDDFLASQVHVVADVVALLKRRLNECE